MRSYLGFKIKFQNNNESAVLWLGPAHKTQTKIKKSSSPFI